jgi:hypothetical protein
MSALHFSAFSAAVLSEFGGKSLTAEGAEKIRGAAQR